MPKIKTTEDFATFVAEVESQSGYRRPLALGVGVARTSEDGILLDTFFPMPNYNQNFGAAAVLANVLGHKSGTATYALTIEDHAAMLDCFFPFLNDGKHHSNIAALKIIDDIWSCSDNTEMVVSFVDQPEFDRGPQSVSDAYLRLHLLSHRLVEPNGINLDGIFAVLPNNAWTNEGPIALDELEDRRAAAMRKGQPLHVNAVDKFPRMVDYVVPSGVRIADASRVRLGAHLAEGTTVMHEGFVNFNAGTLGQSMVEGRISAGVVVGDQSDLGGGCSTMGTLSGGGKEKISIGRGCLIGANAGVGISLGDLCRVEAGLYLTAGTKLTYKEEIVKALELSGRNGLTFRRNSLSGEVEALDQPNDVVLNEVLHQN